MKCPETDFSVMSLNLRFGLADDGENRWEFRKERLSPLFDQYHPDFIGFQEAHTFQIDFLCRVLPGHRYIGKRTPAPPFWQNNVLFYPASWTCLWFDHFFLSITPDTPSRFQDSRWPRQCTIGAFTKKGRSLVCISTHFDFDPAVQTRSACIIQNRLLKKSIDSPVVFMGDFNATPDAPCHAALTAINGSKHGEGSSFFKNAFAPSYPGTFHGFSGKTKIGHIDWILYRGDITPLRSQVITESFEGGYPSDHFPLLVEFFWTSKGKAGG